MNYIITYEDKEIAVLAPVNKKTGKARKTGHMMKIKSTGQIHPYTR